MNGRQPTVNNKLPQLITAKNLEELGYYRHDCYEVACYTAQGKTKNKNEDSILVLPVAEDCLLVAVADGVGSAQSAQQASGLILQTLSDKVTLSGSNVTEMRYFLLEAIMQTNETFSQQGGYLTTLTVCLLARGEAWVFQVGDSGMFVCGQRGKLHYKTTAHSPVGYAIEAGVIDEAEAQEHPDNHLVDNILGNGVANIEMSTAINLAPRDTICLASDGLLDNYLAEELIDTVRKGDLKKVGDNLVQDIQAQHNLKNDTPYIKDDDISFILCRLIT